MSMRSAYPDRVTPVTPTTIGSSALLGILAVSTRQQGRALQRCVEGQSLETRPPHRFHIVRQGEFLKACRAPTASNTPGACGMPGPHPAIEKRWRISWNSMPRSAAPDRAPAVPPGAGRGHGGLDRVGVAAQRLDFSHREMARPRSWRGRGFWPWGQMVPRFIDRARPGQLYRRAPACARLPPVRRK